ncbi:hypothetical protein HMI54_003115 [Coelomomyces lativittatus]|nr:hypothetical protein HMI54_003115 [Coelomomyces lativittatus]
MTSLPRYEKVSTLPPEEETDDTNSSPSSPTNPTSLNSYSSHTTYPISSHANDYTPVPTTHHTLLSTTHTPSSLPSSTSTTTSTSSSSSSSSSKQPLQNIHDGVFSNLSAKPTTVRSSTLNTASSSSSSSPSKDLPPSYDSVASDPAPLYPDTVVFTTATLDSDDEVLVDGLPVGSMVTFFLTMLGKYIHLSFVLFIFYFFFE